MVKSLFIRKSTLCCRKYKTSDKLALSWLVFFLLISVNQLAFAGKKIETRGEEIVEVHGCNEGSSIRNDGNTCYCDAGWDTIGTRDENGNVNCSRIDGSTNPGSSTTPPDTGIPKPPHGGGGVMPKPKPTLEQCANDRSDCIDSASVLVDKCISDANRFYTRELSSNRPCFNQSVETLLDGFEYRKPWRIFSHSCSESHLWSPEYINCTVQYMKRGLGRCRNGQDKRMISRSASEEESEGFSGSIKVFTYSSGQKETNSITVTTSYERGIGFSQTCQNLGIQGLAECSKAGTACEQLANSESMFIGQFVETPENYIARIDRQLLDFLVSSNDTKLPGYSGPFKSLKKGQLELTDNYIGRLKFLADWSGFLSREGISDIKKDKIHQVFISVQSEIEDSFDFYYKLLAAISIEGVTAKGIKINELYSTLKIFESNGGTVRAQKSAETRLKMRINELLTERESKNFYKTFWLSTTHFGFINPMNTRQVQLKNSGQVKK